MWDAWGSNRGNIASLGDSGVIRFNHVPGGANVLYLVGHVEFVKYNSDYPVRLDLPEASLAGTRRGNRARNLEWFLPTWGGQG